ncbi:hypothetical protein ACFLSF_02770 [Candidatus Bipolaricaulota bacterium]
MRGRVIILLVVVALVIAGCSASSGSSGLGARVAAKLFVKDRLKAPSTARFGTLTATESSGGSYRVSGYVDSQNSFGAMVRTYFSCTVEYENGKWKLLGMSL